MYYCSEREIYVSLDLLVRLLYTFFCSLALFTSYSKKWRPISGSRADGSLFGHVLSQGSLTVLNLLTFDRSALLARLT